MSTRPLLISALRYGAVGVVNTAVGLAVILGLELGLGVQANLANAAGYVVGVCVSFVLSRLFVFSRDRPLKSAGSRYIVAVAFAFALNQGVLTLARHLLPTDGLWAALAQASAMVSYTGALFLLSHYWVFAAQHSPSAAPRPWRDWAVAAAVSCAVAVALLSPALPAGLQWSDNHVFNSVWIPEFNAALARGEFIPRWLPGAFLGLGASSFYFYPPLAFYVAAVVDAATMGGLTTVQVLTWASVVMLGLSGLAMFAWLRGQAAFGWALAGAVLYMAAPYHLTNIYVRGAFAEASAYMALPLVLLAVRGAGRDWRWVPALGLAYGLLVCSHIGSALLVTLVAIPPYVVLLWSQAAPGERLRTILRCFCGGVLGLALAAFYLAPALFLQATAQIDTMWSAAPGDWAMLQPNLWKVRPLADALAMMGVAAGGLALIAVIVARRDAVFRPVLALGAAALIGVALYATPLPWNLPVVGSLLSSVQFPWRLLLVVDFAAISALVMATRAARSRRLLLALPLVFLSAQALKVQEGAFRYMVAAEAEPPLAKRQVAMRLAPGEHLPKGYPWLSGLTDAVLRTSAETPPVVAQDRGARILAVRQYPNGAMDVTLDAPRPTRLVLRRFYFVAWQAAALSPRETAQLRVTPYGGNRLASFVAPAGRATYRLEIVRTPTEQAGNAISLVALLCATVLGLWTRRGPQPRAVDQ